MPDYFESSDDLLALFEGVVDGDYFGRVKLNDRKVAFSVKRHYPENIRYSPARKQTGEPDNVVAIWVVYSHPSESEQVPPIDRVPVRIRVATMSLYRIKHFDYDYDDKDSPSREELDRSNATPRPIGLEYPNDFYFDHTRNAFINASGNPIPPRQVLDTAFEEHCNTVHLVKGLRLRTSIAISEKIVALLWLLVQALTRLLKFAFGRTLEDEAGSAGFLRGYDKGMLKKLNEDSLNVFGYKAAKSVIVLFCLISVVGGYIQFTVNNACPYISYVAASNFLTLVHALLGLWILDVLVPHAIFYLVNALIDLRTTIMLRGMK